MYLLDVRIACVGQCWGARRQMLRLYNMDLQPFGPRLVLQRKPNAALGKLKRPSIRLVCHINESICVTFVSSIANFILRTPLLIHANWNGVSKWCQSLWFNLYWRFLYDGLIQRAVLELIGNRPLCLDCWTRVGNYAFNMT